MNGGCEKAQSRLHTIESERSGHRWEINIKMYFTEIGHKYINYIQLEDELPESMNIFIDQVNPYEILKLRLKKERNFPLLWTSLFISEFTIQPLDPILRSPLPCILLPQDPL